MFAAIPFFQLNVYNLPVPGVGNIPLDPWAILVCIGFVLGLEVARARAIRLNLSVKHLVDGAMTTVAVGFLMAHVFTVVFYYPKRLQTDGIWAILRFWEGFASSGGFVGAILGSWVFYRLIHKTWAMRYADVICYGFPFGWFFGRVGCGVVHDHIGSPTNFFLGMDFDNGIGPWVDGHPSKYITGIRHELGLYEAAYMVPVMIIFYLLGRQDRAPGYFLALFGLFYAPARFVLDFLRNNDLASGQDARYAGLTPAQYGMILMFVAAAILFYRVKQNTEFVPLRLDGTGLPVDASRTPRVVPGTDVRVPVAEQPAAASSDDAQEEARSNEESVG